VPWRPPVVIDEIQHVPELLPYIKTRIDQDRRPGRWVLTGSQNFSLMQGVSQSLAGRVAVLSLLPFSFAERIGLGDRALPPDGWLRALGPDTTRPHRTSIGEMLLRGCYPEIASRRRVDRQL
jgi:predicted AAA+ superfamily ATPase